MKTTTDRHPARINEADWHISKARRTWSCLDCGMPVKRGVSATGATYLRHVVR